LDAFDSHSEAKLEQPTL